MDRSSPRNLVAPAVGTGVLLASYLLLRPYGDSHAGTDTASAAAFSSPWWLGAHVAGLLGLASAGRLALRLSEVIGGTTAGIARWTGLAGATLVLPYFGAEAFALHELGRAAVGGNHAALTFVAPIRDNPVAMSLFGVGLLLLAVSGISLAVAWSRHLTPRWAAWPLGILLAAVLPQFYLPPVGRMAFGVACLLAGLLMAWAAWRQPEARAD